MSRETIFNESSVLKQIKLTVDGQEIPRDDIQTCEIKYSMFKPAIEAVFVFRDTFNLKSSDVVKFEGNTRVDLELTDYQREMWRNTFVVEQMTISNSSRETYIMLQCADEASHLLYKYTKAGFSKQSASATLRSKLSEAGCEAVLSKNQKKVVLEDPGGSSEWTIPGNLDYYSFFITQMRKEFAYTYQTHYEYRIGKINIGALKQMEHEYTTDATYNPYMFKIHEHAHKDPSKLRVPKLEVIRYEGKQQIKDVVTVDNVLGQLILNGNADAFKDVQDDSGNTMSATTDPLECQLYDLFEPMLKVNQLAIWTVGSFKFGDVGQKVKVKIGSDTVFNKNHLQGNQTASGIYVVTSLTDYITGEKFIQKHVLSRFDNPKPV